MRRFAEYVRAIVVSPETVAVLLVLLIAALRPQWIESVIQYLAATDGPARIALLCGPAALPIAIHKLSANVLHPKKRELLIAWPEYWLLKTRIRCAWFFGAAGFSAWIGGWLLAMAGHPTSGGTIALAGLCAAAVALASTAAAHYEIDDALDGV